MHSMRFSALHLRLHWIGLTHGDITADCVAKAFGVPVDSDPRALAIMHEWVKTTGAEMNEARLRMTRIPKGADLILNKVSGHLASGIGNVIVMAGVPSCVPPRGASRRNKAARRYQHVDGRRTVPRDERAPRVPCNAVVDGSSGTRPLIANRMKPSASHP